jgi:uncharacterized protein
MPKKLFKRLTPDAKKIQSHKALRIFGKTLHNPNLWHLNRYSVATAFSIGLFCAWLPFPGHMLASSALAILFHANLPLALALVWLSNPLTIPPQFYFAYRLGAHLLSTPPAPFHIELSWSWLGGELLLVWRPLLLGSLICGLLSAIISNILIRLSWRRSVAKQWKARQLKCNK